MVQNREKKVDYFHFHVLSRLKNWPLLLLSPNSTLFFCLQISPIDSLILSCVFHKCITTKSDRIFSSITQSPSTFIQFQRNRAFSHYLDALHLVHHSLTLEKLQLLTGERVSGEKSKKAVREKRKRRRNLGTSNPKMRFNVWAFVLSNVWAEVINFKIWAYCCDKEMDWS